MASTDPLREDTDGDGLRDGVDPRPLLAGTGITFTAESAASVLEGGSTSLVIRATCETSPMTMIEFAPDQPVPPFVWLDPVQFANSDTNGTGVVTLTAAPAFGDAGSYRIKLRAAGADGSGGDHIIDLTVTADSAILITRWKDSVSGNWTDAAKWSAGVPDSTKVAAIDVDGSYTVTLNGNSTAAGLVLGGTAGTQQLIIAQYTLTLNGSSRAGTNRFVDLRGGILAGSGALIVSGTMNWTGGRMSGAATTVIAPGATLTMSTGSYKEFANGRTVTVQGTAVWADGSLYVAEGAGRWNNEGLMDIRSNHSLFAGHWESLTFVNSGTLRKSAGTGTSIIGYSAGGGNKVIENRGVVEVQTGTLRLQGFGGASVHTGRFDVAAGAALEFNSGAHTIAPSAVLNSMEGSVSFNGAAMTFNGQFNALRLFVSNGSTIALGANLSLAEFNLNGGTATLNGSVTITNVTIASGTLAGTGDVRVTDNMNWTGGRMSGAATTLIAPGATLTLSSGSYKEFANGRTVTVQGTAVWTDGSLYVPEGTGRWNNEGLMDIRSNHSLFAGHWESLTFVNSGTLRKSAGTGTSIIGYSAGGGNKVIENRGVVEVQTGTLRLQGFGGASVHTGRFDVAGGAALEFNSGAHTIEPFSAINAMTGNVIFNGAIMTFNGQFNALRLFVSNGSTIALGADLSLSEINLNGGTATLNGSVTVTNVTVTGGTLAGTGDVRLTDNMNWTGGRMSGAATTLIAPGATLTMSTGSHKEFANGRTVTVQGTAVWADGHIYVPEGSGTWNNDGLMELRSNHSLLASHWETLTFINTGTLRKSAGTGTSAIGYGGGGGNKVIEIAASWRFKPARSDSRALARQARTRAGSTFRRARRSSSTQAPRRSQKAPCSTQAPAQFTGTAPT